MERIEEARPVRRIPWGALLAGGVVAIGGGWLGELFAGSISLGAAGEGTAWFAGIVSLALLAIGALVGGWTASRLAAESSRARATLIGLVVWGVLATFSAFNFALLGGNIALVAGEATGAVQVAFGMTTLGLVLALPAALLGGAAGATGEARVARGRELRRERPAAAGAGVREHEVSVAHKPGPGEALPEEHRDRYVTGASYPERQEPTTGDRDRGPLVH